MLSGIEKKRPTEQISICIKELRLKTFLITFFNTEFKSTFAKTLKDFFCRRPVISLPDLNLLEP